MSWFKKPKLNYADKIEPTLAGCNIVDYQESTMENYLSGCCINAIY